MIGVIIAIVFLAVPALLMVGIISYNQLNPSYSSCLAVALYNAVAFGLALVGLVVSVIAYRNHRDMKLAKRTMTFGFACVFVLLLLFPLSNSGLLSVCH